MPSSPSPTPGTDPAPLTYEQRIDAARASAKPGEWCDECDDWVDPEQHDEDRRQRERDRGDYGGLGLEAWDDIA